MKTAYIKLALLITAVLCGQQVAASQENKTTSAEAKDSKAQSAGKQHIGNPFHIDSPYHSCHANCGFLKDCVLYESEEDKAKVERLTKALNILTEIHLLYHLQKNELADGDEWEWLKQVIESKVINYDLEALVLLLGEWTAYINRTPTVMILRRNVYALSILKDILINRDSKAASIYGSAITAAEEIEAAFRKLELEEPQSTQKSSESNGDAQQQPQTTSSAQGSTTTTSSATTTQGQV